MYTADFPDHILSVSDSRSGTEEESSGAGKKINSLRVFHHLVYPFGFVYIEIIPIAYVFEGLNSYR